MLNSELPAGCHSKVFVWKSGCQPVHHIQNTWLCIAKMDCLFASLAELYGDRGVTPTAPGPLWVLGALFMAWEKLLPPVAKESVWVGGTHHQVRLETARPRR